DNKQFGIDVNLMNVFRPTYFKFPIITINCIYTANGTKETALPTSIIYKSLQRLFINCTTYGSPVVLNKEDLSPNFSSKLTSLTINDKLFDNVDILETLFDYSCSTQNGNVKSSPLNYLKTNLRYLTNFT